MKLIVHGRNVDITEHVREYVAKKVGKLERYLPQLGDVRAELTQNMTRSANDRYTAQITLWTNGQILRAEESTSDIFASIDTSVDKISKQIRRFKGRRFGNKRRASQSASLEMALAAEEEEAVEESTGSITRRKQFVVSPMDEEEALEQMELLGHDFYLFYNAQANSVNLIYRRRDGNYGLLQPMMS